MNSWTIGKRIIVTASFLCAVIAAVVATAILSVNKISHISLDITEDSLPGVIYGGRMKVAQGENMIRLGQFGSSENPERRKQLAAEMAEITKKNQDNIKGYEDSISSDEERRLYEIYKERRTAFVELRNKKYMPLLESNPAEAKEFFDGPLMESYKTYNSAVDSLIEFAIKEGQANSKKLAAMVTLCIRLLTGIGLAGLLIGSITSILSIRSINSALKKITNLLNHSADQVASASSEVSASSQKLAEGASEQAASLEETSSSMEEMSSIVQLNANSAQNAKGLADATRQTATTSVEHVQQLKGSVTEAQASSGQLTEAMEAIKASSDSIAQIIKTIDEIAFQTNILALNAAVEAARAGEAGMGFAVVADEVRNLAKRSADAAKETATIIEDSIRKGNNGVRVNEEVVKKLHDIDSKSQQVDSGLKEIFDRVTKVDEAMGQIATASREQTQGIGQINIALNQMDKVTQSNAASAEETASAAGELNSQADELKNAVIDLLALVEGRKGHTALHASAQPPTNAAPRAIPPSNDKHFASSVKPSAASRPTTEAAPPRAASRDAIPMDSDFKDMN